MISLNCESDIFDIANILYFSLAPVLYDVLFSSLNALPFDYTAALFIETVSWMMFVIGVLYISFGLCCCQVYQTKVRENYKDRLAERKKIFEDGLNSLEFRHDHDDMT